MDGASGRYRAVGVPIHPGAHGWRLYSAPRNAQHPAVVVSAGAAWQPDPAVYAGPQLAGRAAGTAWGGWLRAPRTAHRIGAAPGAVTPDWPAAAIRSRLSQRLPTEPGSVGGSNLPRARGGPGFQPVVS